MVELNAEPAVPTRRTPARRTQETRRLATRKRLLDATIESLIECGYHGATTLEIERRAGVSRGARIHHFPTKASLLAAAVDHLYDQVSSSYELAFGRTERDTSDAQRVRSGLRTLWSIFRAPDYSAVVELNVAARTDAELRERLREVARRHRGLALDAAARHFALPAAVAFVLIEGTHAALMGLLLRRNIELDDASDAAVIRVLEELIISHLPQQGAPRAAGAQLRPSNEE